MRARTIALLASLAFAGTGHAGEILRCVGTSGEVMYTNLGCPANTQSHHVSDYVAVPDAPPTARELAAEEAALAASRAEQAAARAEAAAYHQASYYEASAEPERGGPYHQYEDNNVYYPAWFGGYPLAGAVNRHHHGAHHTTSARTAGGSGDRFHGVRPQPISPQPVKFYGGPRR